MPTTVVFLFNPKHTFSRFYTSSGSGGVGSGLYRNQLYPANNRIPSAFPSTIPDGDGKGNGGDGDGLKSWGAVE